MYWFPDSVRMFLPQQVYAYYRRGWTEGLPNGRCKQCRALFTAMQHAWARVPHPCYNGCNAQTAVLPGHTGGPRLAKPRRQQASCGRASMRFRHDQ